MREHDTRFFAYLIPAALYRPIPALLLLSLTAACQYDSARQGNGAGYSRRQRGCGHHGCFPHPCSQATVSQEFAESLSSGDFEAKPYNTITATDIVQERSGCVLLP